MTGHPEPPPCFTEEEKDRPTLKALADVDAGRFIDDEVVQAWIESLGTDNPLPAPWRRENDSNP